jgi:ABC-type phosphate transport system substrate-binding protein
MRFSQMTRSGLTQFGWIGLLVIWPSIGQAQDGFRVIVHPTNPVNALRPATISKLFLRKQTKWPNGQPVQPVDQVESSPVRRKFSQAIHGMDVPSVKSFWQEVVFSGRGEPPPERASDADVIVYVRVNPNAVGYIADSTTADGVKVITVIIVTP